MGSRSLAVLSVTIIIVETQLHRRALDVWGIEPRYKGCHTHANAPAEKATEYGEVLKSG